MSDSNRSRVFLRNLCGEKVRIGHARIWRQQRVPNYFIVAEEGIENNMIMWQLRVSLKDGRRAMVVFDVGIFRLDPATEEELTRWRAETDTLPSKSEPTCH